MHPATHARVRPDHPAIRVAGTGEVWSYDRLDRASNRVAQLFRARGLGVGATVALCLDNRPDYLAIAWGAQRAGLSLVAVSTRLTAAEIAYIVDGFGCPADHRRAGDRAGVRANCPTTLSVPVMSVGGDFDEAFLPTMPGHPHRRRAGGDRHALLVRHDGPAQGHPPAAARRAARPIDAGRTAWRDLAQMAFGMGEETVYLSPAPLYHAAPLRWCLTAHRLGGTVVLMEKFEPEAALKPPSSATGVTHAQWVPTHFVRMLKLPHAAARRA